jgi:hypothetical protein
VLPPGIGKVAACRIEQLVKRLLRQQVLQFNFFGHFSDNENVMKLTLIVKVGETSQEHHFDQTLCVIGRKDADLLLTDRQCSRNHAVLYESENGDLHVKDLNSSNGTFFDDSQLSDQVLTVGDTFRIGAAEITVEDFVPNSSMTFVGNVHELIKKPIPGEATSKSIHIEKPAKKKAS